MSAIAAADALMIDAEAAAAAGANAAEAAAHPPPAGGQTPTESATLEEEAQKPPSQHAHPELLSAASPDQVAQAEQAKEEGNKFFAANKYMQARDAYTRAIDLNPRVAAYFSNRSFTELKLEEYGSAIADADKALELDRTFIKAYYRRGAAHMALGKTKEARADFKTVVKIKPNDKDAQAKLKECEKAIYAAAFAKAIEGEKRKPASETIGDMVKDMQIESSYSGPRYVSGAIDVAFVKDLMEHFKSQKKLPKKYVYEILMDIIPLLRSLPSLVDIDVPAGSKFTVYVDTHC
jgi:serine/threonine-protein phosphatase 5